ncbi:hypothetical protein VVD49_00725 [Uliginosibacterium sp. H3]|uniref:DUF2946 domain-containing protein n=1 Tax=Uliginosibacterium silvisoli TaxID=3114758 RepID=A0ABU6JY35_9RHOO|nr:hypothetical protein [Uliginosibacterium sp. H3]
MRPSSNRLVAFVLALFVLFAQQGATLHALSHATQEVASVGQKSPDRQSPSGHENCEQCLSFAAAGGAMPASQHGLSLFAFAHVVRASLPPACLASRTTTAYQSRAPPYLPA